MSQGTHRGGGRRGARQGSEGRAAWSGVNRAPWGEQPGVAATTSTRKREREEGRKAQRGESEGEERHARARGPSGPAPWEEPPVGDELYDSALAFLHALIAFSLSCLVVSCPDRLLAVLSFFRLTIYG